MIYGKNFRPVKQPTEAGHVVKEKLDRIESMKKMYNIHPSPPTTTTTTNPPVSKPTSRSNAKRISTKTPIGKLKGNTADQVETDHDSGRDTPGLYTKFTLRSGSTSAASRGVVSHSSDMEGEEDEDQWEEEADALVDWSRSLTDTTTTDPLS